MKRAETGRPHLFRLIAMIHKTAYILAYDMLRRKGGHDWVERRAGGIIGLPYLSLILVALLTLKDDPNNGQKIVTGILIGWAVVAAWCISCLLYTSNGKGRGQIYSLFKISESAHNDKQE